MRTSEKYRHGKLPLALNQLFDKSDRLHPNIVDVVKKTSAVATSAMIKLILNLVFAIHIVVITTNTTSPSTLSSSPPTPHRHPHCRHHHQHHIAIHTVVITTNTTSPSTLSSSPPTPQPQPQPVPPPKLSPSSPSPKHHLVQKYIKRGLQPMRQQLQPPLNEKSDDDDLRKTY